MTYEQTTLPGSMVKFTLTIPASDIQTEVASAKKDIISNFEMDGFRRGHVPEAVAIAKVGSMAIWEEALRRALPNLYLQILTETQIQAIGRPTLSVTSIVDQGDATATAVTAVLPAFELPNLKSITQQVFSEKTPTPVTDQDVADALLQLRKMRYERENPAPESANNESESPAEFDESQLPELTDEYAASFGAGVTDVADLTQKIRKNLEHEMIHQFEDKKRGELIESVLSATTLEVPELLINYEIDKIMSEYEHDLAQSGISMDQYLEHIKKTRDDIRKDLREGGIKRAKTQLILEAIAKSESITADQSAVDAEVQKLAEQYKDNPHFDENSARSYVEQILTNQAVFKHLEKMGGYVPHDHDAMMKNE